MKHITTILLLLASTFALSQSDTTAVDSVGTDDIVYEYVVVTDTIIQDSTTTYVERLEKRRTMSIGEYNNLLAYNRYLATSLTEQMKSLRMDLELAREKLQELGKPGSLADPIRDEIQGLTTQRDIVKIRIEELVADKQSIRDKYIDAAKKKRKKAKELEAEGIGEDADEAIEETPEAPQLSTKLQDAVDKAVADKNTSALMKLLKAELVEIAEYYALSKTGTKAVISDRILAHASK